MPKTPDKPPRRRGRPSRADELQQALSALAIDPRTVDPGAVRAGIMMDAAQPAAARVQAARLLIAARDQAAGTKRPAKAEPRRVVAARAAAFARTARRYSFCRRRSPASRCRPKRLATASPA